MSLKLSRCQLDLRIVYDVEKEDHDILKALGEELIKDKVFWASLGGSASEIKVG